MSGNRDKDYEALLENYEDALMRLVMYRVAIEDGKRLLEEAEALKRSGFEVPKEFEQKCMQLIQAGCAPAEHNQSTAKSGSKPVRRLSLREMGRVLMAAILAAVLLFGVAYAANEQFRVNVLNFFLELRENGTWFSFSSGDSGEAQPNLFGTSVADEDFPFEFTYIPDGYELFKRRVSNLGDVGTAFYLGYYRPDDEYCNFFLGVSPISESTGMLVDTEDAEVINATIHGHNGWSIKKVDVSSGKECTMYLWLDLVNGYSYQYCNIGSSDNEAQKIFENIVINEQYLGFF